MMNKKEDLEDHIIAWLTFHPGYLKCSAKRIKSRLKRDFGDVDIKIIQSALKTAKNGLKTPISKPVPSPTMIEVENKPFKRLFFDIETSYNTVASWNVGQKISLGTDNILKERAIICICYKWANEDTVHSLNWERGDDKKMLKAFIKVLDQADEIIGHNSDRYDIRWIRTRCIKHDIPMFPTYQSLDTLKATRGGFRFNSNRLDYLGEFLGLGRKLNTGGFSLWKDIVENNDPIALDGMIEYCKQDVVLLEAVYNKLNPYIKHKTHAGVVMGNDACSCPNCGSKDTVSRGFRYLASGGRNKILQCKACNKKFGITEARFKKLREE